MNPPSSKPAVTIMVVAYNSAAILSACLNAIPRACQRYAYEVLLLDNGDGSSEALVEERFPDVLIIPRKGNVGFAAGNNLIASHARGDYLLLANPDLEMKAHAVDELIDAAARYPAAAAWGGVTLDRTGQPDKGNSVHVPSLKEMASRLLGRSINRLELGNGLLRDQRVEALSGGFVMFLREVWEQAGGMEERYFLYCEEVDLFFRLGQMGYEFWRIGTARAFHDAGHGNDFSPSRLLYQAAGTMQFAQLHWPYAKRQIAFVMIWGAALQRFWAGRILGEQNPRLRKLGEGYRLVAGSPNDWRHGYHPTRGLLVRQRRR